MDAAPRDELLAMAAEDRRVRAEFAADASLFDGYLPRTEEVHCRNVARLTEIIGRTPWPSLTCPDRSGSWEAKVYPWPGVRWGSFGGKSYR